MTWSCPGCGIRCLSCGDRMCAQYGPEPAEECGRLHCAECPCVDGECGEVAVC